MPSSYYTHASGKPANQTRGLASEVRYELDSIAASFALLPSPTALASGSINYALDTGLTNAYVVSVSSAVTAYSDGFSFFFKPLNNNSGASTLNVNTLGLKAIVRPDGTAVQLNDIVANQILKLTYNSSYNGFQLDTDISYANQAAASASAAAASAGSAAASAAATAGAIVAERSATATLTNKSIDLGSNTVTMTSAQLKAALTDETGSGAAVFATSPTLVTPALGAATADSLLVTTTGSGLGYGIGAGGTVTQATSKSTAVTLNKPSALITLNNASLAANSAVTFVFSSTSITATDALVINLVSGYAGTAADYSFSAVCAAGLAVVVVRNMTVGALAEAIVIKAIVVKGANA